MARVTIDVEKIETVAADDRGRVYLGSKYAEEDVEVAVIGIVDQESKAEVEANAGSESKCESMWTPRELSKGNDGIPEDEKGDVPAERPGCPECGSTNLGVEDMDAGDTRIYCVECGSTLQVG